MLQNPKGFIDTALSVPGRFQLQFLFPERFARNYLLARTQIVRHNEE